jgi:hypothetical protein
MSIRLAVERKGRKRESVSPRIVFAILGLIATACDRRKPANRQVPKPRARSQAMHQTRKAQTSAAWRRVEILRVLSKR